MYGYNICTKGTATATLRERNRQTFAGLCVCACGWCVCVCAAFHSVQARWVLRRRNNCFDWRLVKAAAAVLIDRRAAQQVRTRVGRTRWRPASRRRPATPLLTALPSSRSAASGTDNVCVRTWPRCQPRVVGRRRHVCGTPDGTAVVMATAAAAAAAAGLIEPWRMQLRHSTWSAVYSLTGTVRHVCAGWVITSGRGGCGDWRRSGVRHIASLLMPTAPACESTITLTFLTVSSE